MGMKIEVLSNPGDRGNDPSLSYNTDIRDPVRVAYVLPRNIHTMNLNYSGPFTLS